MAKVVPCVKSTVIIIMAPFFFTIYLHTADRRKISKKQCFSNLFVLKFEIGVFFTVLVFDDFIVLN